MEIALAVMVHMLVTVQLLGKETSVNFVSFIKISIIFIHVKYVKIFGMFGFCFCFLYFMS